LLKGLGDLAKMGGMLKQAKDMMANMEAMKEKLGEEQIEASAGGGMVTVVMSGKMEVLSVKIDPEIANTDDLKMLETLVRAAINEASLKAKDMVKEKMAEMTGGLDIPGLT
jgi:DNA-binding YbaB/EbfC family protein